MRLAAAALLLAVSASAEPLEDAFLAAQALPVPAPREAVGLIGPITNCPFAVPGDGSADDDELQACLDRGGTLLLKGGGAGYLLRKGLTVRVPNVKIASDGGEKVLFVADPALNAPMLQVRGDVADGLELSNLRFDGNRDKRRIVCQGYRGNGTNVSISGSRGLRAFDVDSVNAMCGSAFEVYAADYEIARLHVKDAGFDRAHSGSPEPWADGLTLGTCAGGYVHDSLIEDATDIGLVSGGGAGCRVEDNVVRNARSHAFAGLAVHNFHGDTTDPYYRQGDSAFRRNRVESAPGLVDLGLSVGIHPWFPDALTIGGVVEDNAIVGASVGVAIDGYASGIVRRNEVLGERGRIPEWGLVRCGYAGAYAAGHATQVELEKGYDGVTFHGGACQVSSIYQPPDDDGDPGSRRPRKPLVEGASAARAPADEPPSRSFPPQYPPKR